MNIRAQLERRISDALTRAAGSDRPLPALVSPSGQAKFGDYQANGVMAAAKQAKTNPRELAAKVIEQLDLSDLAEKVEIAGPGFINITLKREFLQQQVNAAADDERLGVPPNTTDYPDCILVEYSSPNLAKEMHVGHLRSTIIGDAIANVLEFLGNEVIRRNHVGDWGTQFGMLIAFLRRARQVPGAKPQELRDIEDVYRDARALFDSNPAFADEARKAVVELQSGEESATAEWKRLTNWSVNHIQDAYVWLNVGLRPEHVWGESRYNDRLPSIIDELQQKGMLVESQGAKCVFLDEFRAKDGSPLPLIVRKSDGGYLYATTDLAAIQHRVMEKGFLLKRILYVVDARQALHFSQVFAVAYRAGFAVKGQVSLEHIAFGTVLGEDGRPFKTREGGTIKLMDLLDEAEQRAAAIIAEKNPELPSEQQEQVAKAVGIGAVKYADLSMDRISDYKFSWGKMLSFQGNTAPYMQYAYARVRSIFRKGAEQAAGVEHAPIAIIEPAERDLARRLVGFQEVLEAVAAECKPNYLTAYLFDLATAFSTFYENCPVLKAEPEVRASRLRLCDLTARVLAKGLDLLGIEVIEQM